MSEIAIHEYKKKDIADAFAIVAFPTIGMVSTIVANFLITQLKLERIAAMMSDDFYPAAIVHDGVPTPPVRIFAGDAVCGLEKECGQIVVITSELPPKPSSLSSLADTIIGWCAEHKCRTVITIEGLNSQKVQSNDVKVLYVSSTKAAAERMEALNVDRLATGMVSGISGLLLYKGNIRSFNVTSMLAEANPEFPDSRSAAAVLTLMNAMIPQIEMDPEPLKKQAAIIEEQIKNAVAQIKTTPPEADDTPLHMYG